MAQGKGSKRARPEAKKKHDGKTKKIRKETETEGVRKDPVGRLTVEEVSWGGQCKSLDPFLV